MHVIATLTRHASLLCTMYDIVISRKPSRRFRPHEDDKSAVFETLTSGDHCRESTFLAPENGVYVCGRKAKTEEKNLRCQKYPHMCGRGLMEYRVTEINAPLKISFKFHVNFMKH